MDEDTEGIMHGLRRIGSACSSNGLLKFRSGCDISILEVLPWMSNAERRANILTGTRSVQRNVANTC